MGIKHCGDLTCISCNEEARDEEAEPIECATVKWTSDAKRAAVERQFGAMTDEGWAEWQAEEARAIGLAAKAMQPIGEQRSNEAPTKSRSVLRREAAQRGEEPPDFSAPRPQEAPLGTNELANLVIRELMPLAHRIAKGRAKYANGCTVLSLLDEAGEVAHAVNKYESAERIREELLDVAAVAMRLYFGEIDRGLEIDGLVQRRTDK